MKIRTAEYYVQEVFRSLRRNNWMTFAAVGTVAVSLFILGVFLILALNMNRAASGRKDPCAAGNRVCEIRWARRGTRASL